MAKFGTSKKSTFGSPKTKTDNIKRLGQIEGVTVGLSPYGGSVNGVLEFPGQRAVFVNSEKMAWLAKNAGAALKLMADDEGVDTE